MPSSKTLSALPQAILFDHDGVLVASEPLHWQAWGMLLDELGLPYHENEVKALVGKTAPEILVELLNRHQPGWPDSKDRQYDVHALARRKNDFYLILTKTGLKAYPGVREGLQWLRQVGIRAAVVSNAKRRELVAALKLLDLEPLFDQIISRDEAGIPKPDPTPYLFAAAALGVEPARCLAVEDSPPGIESALMAKIPAVAVLTNFPEKIMAQPVPGRPDLQPVWTVTSMVEFFERLRKLR